MLYNPHTLKTITPHISKLIPIKYNQFRWWRRFESPFKPLPKGATFHQRIRNGEFEFSHYFWQAHLCEHEINQKYAECSGDMVKLLEKHKVDFARRKRLWEDFQAHESEMLHTICVG